MLDENTPIPIAILVCCSNLGEAVYCVLTGRMAGGESKDGDQTKAWMITEVYPWWVSWSNRSVSWVRIQGCILGGCPAGTGLQLWLRLQRGHTGHLSHPPPLAQRRGHRKKTKTQERLKPSCTTKRDTRKYINVQMGTHKKKLIYNHVVTCKCKHITSTYMYLSIRS